MKEFFGNWFDNASAFELSLYNISKLIFTALISQIILPPLREYWSRTNFSFSLNLSVGLEIIRIFLSLRKFNASFAFE